MTTRVHKATPVLVHLVYEFSLAPVLICNRRVTTCAVVFGANDPHVKRTEGFHDHVLRAASGIEGALSEDVSPACA